MASNVDFYCFDSHGIERAFPKWGKTVPSKLPDGREHSVLYDRFTVILKERNMTDIIWAGYWTCLIQDHVLDAFRAAELTGFGVQPVDARFLFPCSEKRAKLWLLYVTGWGGVASQRSGIKRILDESTDELLYTKCTDERYLIDEEQWDGSDFFIVWPLPLCWWITPRVKDLLLDHGFQRYEIVPLGQNGIGESDFAEGVYNHPGRLSRWFPSERAHEIGDPLGIY